ncbi:hypothetical protein ACUSIJ_22180 [Pseudochelatococcus sp. B33]
MALAAVPLAFLCGAAGAVAACLDASGAGEPVAVARVTGHGDVALTDGRILRITGIAPLDDAAMAAAIRRHVADGVRVVAVAGKPDRWGRHDAQLAVSTETGVVSLIEPLVAEGLAVWRADSILPPRAAARSPAAGLSEACAARLNALEAAARRAGRGGWGGAAPMPLAADDPRRLKQYEGRFVIVTGRVVSVGERRKMIYINFGRIWSRDFFVEIVRTDWEKMAKEGVTAGALEGRTVMVRGDLLLRDVASGTARRTTGSAPVIRLSVARGISIVDSD